MIRDDQPGDELDRLIDDFAEGGLDSAQAQRLLELIETSPGARARIASEVAVERLLRALGRGAVPSARIMSAINAERNRPAARDMRAPQQTARLSRNLGWALAILLALAAAFAAFLRFRPEEQRVIVATARAAPPAPPAPSVEKPVETISAPAPAEPAPAAEPAETGMILRPIFPFELPPPPADLPPAPAGDGSGEPGFAMPPAEWTAAQPAAEEEETSSGERRQPEPPLLWVKVRLPETGDEADAATDLAALAAAVETRLGLRYGWTVRPIEELDADPAHNPILLFATHRRLSFTPAQRALLRRYVLKGGMVVFNASAGSAPAYDAARRELLHILPEAPIERLGADHPLYHAFYDLDRVSPIATARSGGRPADLPWFDAMTLACRTVALISRWDMASGWAGRRSDQCAVYAPEDALRLGINLSSYATAVRAWTRQTAMQATYPEEATSDAGRIFIAQVEYGGEWRTRYAALPRLLHAFNQRTEVPVKLGIRAMRLNDPGLFNAPLLYLTGHESLRLEAEELGALKRYLENGGFLFAEACCGRRAFDRSFRALMERLLPGHPLERIPEDSPLYHMPHRIEKIGVTPSWAARVNAMAVRPILEGIRMGDSYSVVYSPFGLAGSWEASPMPYADGYDDPAALKLGQNILFHAVTQ